MAGQWNIQWLNANSQRSYPLTDEATKTDTTGTITLPDDFLVSLHLPVHAGQNVAPERFYIQSIGIYASGYVLKLGYNDGITYPVVAITSIDAAGHTENAVYSLTGPTRRFTPSGVARLTSNIRSWWCTLHSRSAT